MKHLSSIIAVSSALMLAACMPSNGSSNSSASSSSVAASSSSSAESDMISVDTPHANALVSSPLIVKGEARGMWYFEASFPVKLLDANGKEVMVTYAQAEGDWMTENFVPFTSTLSFDAPSTPTGTLVLQKDNPSGLPENDASITIPVRFR